nr:hypothetical protein [Providencia rettgeri]
MIDAKALLVKESGQVTYVFLTWRRFSKVSESLASKEDEGGIICTWN